MGKKKRRGEQSLQLTDDLITDIISRVPEKDLMRFTCVSKSWHSLINSTDSYLSQLRSQRTALLGRPFFIIHKIEYLPLADCFNYYNYWVEFDSIEDGNPNPRQLRNPFDGGRDTCVIGSCDGLLVLQQHSTHKMVVLNPTTKELHVVPPNPAGDDNVEFMGFGYDRVHGCYKLVTEIRRAYMDNRLELMIYNVDNGTWKKSRFDGLGNDCPFRSCDPRKCCVDGALYWCHKTKMRKILRFVLAEEEFHEVDPPYFDEGCKSYLTVFDGRLCLVCSKGQPDWRVQLWLMEGDPKRQLGSSYSCRWVEFLSILDPRLKLLDPLLKVRDDSPHLIPICFSECENKILFKLGCYRLLWYDIGKNKFNRLKIRVNYKYSFVDVHVIVPSLVGIGIS